MFAASRRALSRQTERRKQVEKARIAAVVVSMSAWLPNWWCRSSKAKTFAYIRNQIPLRNALSVTPRNEKRRFNSKLLAPAHRRRNRYRPGEQHFLIPIE